MDRRGRDDGEREGEFMAVFFDTRRLEPLEHDHFWLSDTPEVPGSKSWGNNVIRMVTWVRFLHSPPGEEPQELVFFNTHFDHQSANAREKSAALVLERINELDPALPVVLAGDFNAAAGASRPYEILVDEGGFLDTWEMARRRGTAVGASPGGYRDPVPGGPRIDWLLARDLQNKVGDFRYAHFDNDYYKRADPTDGHKVSDHDPPVLTLSRGPRK